jgi:hemerythrin
MALFVWDNKLKTNISICDEQHQKLTAILNELHEAMKNKKDKSLIEKTLNELVEYTLFHFKAEEQLLEQYEFPDLNNHRAEHAYFIREAYDLKKRFNNGETALTIDVFTSLKDRVKDHITGVIKTIQYFCTIKGYFNWVLFINLEKPNNC